MVGWQKSVNQAEISKSILRGLRNVFRFHYGVSNFSLYRISAMEQERNRMILLHQEAQSRVEPSKNGLIGRTPLEAGDIFMIRCNKRVADDVREFCLMNDIAQRAFFEEAAARLLFQERIRKRKIAIMEGREQE